jgi:predicted nucleic-acid-binding protein
MYRSKLSPEEAFQRDTKRAGWSKWLAAKTQFDARLEQQGFTSFSQSPMLDREKQQFLSQMANDPMYQGWFLDYNEFGSARTEATVLVMKAALSDSTFVADHMDDPIWQAASEYLNGRAQVENQLRIQGGAIDSIGNRNVSQWWDKFRTNLMNVPGWDVFSNRYLDGDDDPTNTGITIGSTMSGAA